MKLKAERHTGPVRSSLHKHPCSWSPFRSFDLLRVAIWCLGKRKKMIVRWQVSTTNLILQMDQIYSHYRRLVCGACCDTGVKHLDTPTGAYFGESW